MVEDRPTYPHLYAVRLTPTDREKLLGFADTLGLTPGQVLRFLLRQAVHTGYVQFAGETALEPVGVGSRD